MVVVVVSPVENTKSALMSLVACRDNCRLVSSLCQKKSRLYNLTWGSDGITICFRVRRHTALFENGFGQGTTKSAVDSMLRGAFLA